MKKGGEQRRREHNKRNAMVFGDNVRARKAARALPRTPTQIGRGRKRGKQRKTNDKTTHSHSHSHPPPFHTLTTQCDKARHALPSQHTHH